MSNALLAGFSFEAHGEMVVQVYMADRFSTFFLCNENRKTVTVRPEVEKVVGGDIRKGTTKETDDIRCVLLSNR
jgi:hypothetical protein